MPKVEMLKSGKIIPIDGKTSVQIIGGCSRADQLALIKGIAESVVPVFLVKGRGQSYLPDGAEIKVDVTCNNHKGNK